MQTGPAESNPNRASAQSFSHPPPKGLAINSLKDASNQSAIGRSLPTTVGFAALNRTDRKLLILLINRNSNSFLNLLTISVNNSLITFAALSTGLTNLFASISTILVINIKIGRASWRARVYI